jgi:adenylate cyclase class 2
MYEVETKILEVNKDQISQKLNELGAELLQDTKLVVDWYGPKGLTHNGDDPWFLRVRTYQGGKSEITWKGKSNILGASRSHQEINFDISDAEKVGDLFLALDLEKYAHQEKYRTSWQYQNWRFDLDVYPKMPAYLEIEGKDEQHIQEAIKLLQLQNHKSSHEGERVLIQKEYNLDWNDMRF